MPGTEKNSKYVQSSGGEMLGKGILGGTLGAAATFGAGYAISTLLTIGTTAVVSGPAAPIVAIGGAIGALFGLFS